MKRSTLFLSVVCLYFCLNSCGLSDCLLQQAPTSTPLTIKTKPVSGAPMIQFASGNQQQQQSPQLKLKLKEQQLNRLQKYLNERQLQLVRENPGSLGAIARALKMTILECQHQMRQEQWDCPIYGYSAKPIDVFGKLMSRSFRETSFINSLLSAALTHSIARACTEGQIQTCGRKLTRDGGFSEDIEFGQLFTQQFMEASHETPASSPGNAYNAYIGPARERHPVASSINSVDHQESQLQQQQQVANLNSINDDNNLTNNINQIGPAQQVVQLSSNSLIPLQTSNPKQQAIANNHPQTIQTSKSSYETGNGLPKGPYGRSQQQQATATLINDHQLNTISVFPASSSSAASRRTNYEMRNSIREMIDNHNDELGRLLVLNNMRRACKCHGVSGACTAQTCWLQLPPFREVANQLHEKFNQAIQLQSYYLARPLALSSHSSNPFNPSSNSRYLYGISASAPALAPSSSSGGGAGAQASNSAATRKSNKKRSSIINHHHHHHQHQATLNGFKPFAHNHRDQPEPSGGAGTAFGPGLEATKVNRGALYAGPYSSSASSSNLTGNSNANNNGGASKHHYHRSFASPLHAPVQLPNSQRPSKRHTLIISQSGTEMNELPVAAVAPNCDLSSAANCQRQHHHHHITIIGGATSANNGSITIINQENQSQSHNQNRNNATPSTPINPFIHLHQPNPHHFYYQNKSAPSQIRRPVARSIASETQHHLQQVIPSKLDLIYQLQSPDFCKRSDTYMIKGTKGRLCSENPNAPDRCDKLCCNRGYKTEVREEKYNCECIFKFCCELDCKTCTRRKVIHKCL